MDFNAVTRITIQVTPVQHTHAQTQAHAVHDNQHQTADVPVSSSSKVKGLLNVVEMRQYIGYKRKQLCVVYNPLHWENVGHFNGKTLQIH